MSDEREKLDQGTEVEETEDEDFEGHRFDVGDNVDPGRHDEGGNVDVGRHDEGGNVDPGRHDTGD